MFDQFGVNPSLLEGFKQTEAGLLLPKDINPKDIKQVIKEISSGSPAEQAAYEKRLDRKLGTLMSAYYSLFATQLSTMSGAVSKPRHTPPMTLLRQSFRQSLVDQLIILARIEQVKFVAQRTFAPKKKKGWLIRHKRYADPYFKLSKEDEKRIEEVSEVVAHPWEEVHPSFKDFLVKFTEDQLIIDRVCAPITRSYTGKPLKWYLIPGDDVKPRYDVLLRYMQEHNIYDEKKVLGIFFAQQGIDLTDMAYVQEIDDFRIAGAWKKGELALHISNPTNEMNNYGWGRSCFERSLAATTMLLLSMQYNTKIFQKNYPDQMIVLRGEMDPIGLEYFKQQIYGTNGPQSNERLPILPTNDPQFQMDLLKLRDSMSDMQFIQMMRLAVSWKCSAFRMHPSTLNMSPDQGERGTVIAGVNDQADVIASMQEEGYKGLLNSIADFINTNLIEPWYDDLFFDFSIEDIPPEADRVALWTQKLSNGLTFDEYRADEGLAPLEEITEGKYDGKVPGSPFILQAKELDMQQEMAEEQAAMEEERADMEGFTGGGAAKKLAKKPAKKPETKKKPTKKSWWLVDRFYKYEKTHMEYPFKHFECETC